MDPMVLLAVLRRMVPRDLMVDRTVPQGLRQQVTGQPVRQEAADPRDSLTAKNAFCLELIVRSPFQLLERLHLHLMDQLAATVQLATVQLATAQHPTAPRGRLHLTVPLHAKRPTGRRAATIPQAAMVLRAAH